MNRLSVPVSALAALLFASLGTLSVSAAAIAWSTATVAAPSDVSTVGTLVGAMNVGSATAQTVNGVTFASNPTGAGTLTLGSATVSFGNLASTFNNFWTAANPDNNAPYAAALDTARFGASGNGTVTLGGLTAGRTYLVQLWIADTRAGFDTRVRTVDGVATTSGGPNIATGAFVADAATQVITVDDGANTFGPQVNLLQVRDVTFTVTTTADSGAGSLRQALADAAALAGADTLTFAAALSGQTITLGSEIVVNGTGGVTVDATALAGGLTVNGDGGNRLFSIGTAGSVALAGLNLTGGDGGGATSVGFGGAILNRGTLTLTRCTLSGNTAAFLGGAIANTATLTLRQCTLSGNTAAETFGGGLHNSGSAHLLHCTVAGNNGVESGGGLYNTSALTLENSLVAGNFSAGVADIFNGGTLTRVGANLVQTAVGGTLAGTGTLTVANPLLAALAANNGPTPTRATSPASPARNAAVGSAITADQRGYALFGAADIGAYEGQLGTIAAVTVNEDTATGALPFSVGTVGTLSATSDNTALVPNASLVLGGSGGSRTLTATPAQDASGTATLTVTDTVSGEATSFVLAVGTPDLALERPPGTDLPTGGSTDLGSVALGASGTAQTFTLRNTGSLDLTGLALTVDGAMPGDFAVSAPGATTLAPGATTTFTVTFTPGGPDFRTARLRVASNDPDENPFTLRLTGTGTSAAPLALAQRAYAKPNNTGAGDQFGTSVAVSGDTVVVGAPFEDGSGTDAGAAYVFVRSGSTWTQQAYLKASNTGASDFFGISVAVSGDTVVVGADGESSNATGVNGNQSNNSASAAGAAYVFVRSGGTWSQQAYLKASNTGALDQFGGSVAVSGDTVVVGAYSKDTAGGAAYVFVRSSSTWTQQAYLKASNPGALDQFGGSVAVSGDTVVVGAKGEDSNATGVNGNEADNSAGSAGAAYVFVQSGSTWSQQAYLKASNTGEGDWFGWSVAVSGDTVVVGAYLEDSNATGVNDPLTGGSGTQADNSAGNAGAAYVFVRSGSTWSQQAYLKASNTEAGDRFGQSVAVSGDTVVVGAYLEDSNDNSASAAGAAYVFVRSGSTWSQQAYLKASNTGAGDNFGNSVAVSGDTVVVGAPAEDSNALGVNDPLTGGSGTQDDNSADNAGAAYVFGAAFAPTDLALTATSVAENQLANTTVGTLSGTDPDAGQAATLTFSLVGGTGSTDNTSFNVSGNTLRTSASFNFEAKSSYSIRLRATDPDGLTYNEVFTVTVTDVNETPTATNLSAAESYTEDVSRNLVNIVITDPDNAPVTATLTLSTAAAGVLSTATSGTVTSTFVAGVWTASGAVASVNALLAGVTFTPAANFNAGFTLTTSVTDGTTTLTGSKAMTGIAVNDAPGFTKGADQSLASGTTAAQTVLGWATALSDGDGGGQVLTFTVTETGSSGLFTTPPAVAANGTLTYTPNGTVGTATFSVTLTDDATQGGAALTTAPQTFTIAVGIDYTVTTTGGVLTVAELTSADNTLTLTQPSAGHLQFAAAGRSFSVPLAGITQVIVNAGAGNDTLNVGVAGSGNPFTAFPSLTLNGGTGDDTVNFNRDVTFAAGANLDVDLQNDDATPGVDQVTVESVVTLSGTGTATVKVSRSIQVRGSARLETADGALLLEANRQAVPTAADFSGMTIFGTVRSTGLGAVTVRGTGGAGSGGFNRGIDCSGTLTSGGGAVVVTGQGGGSGSSGSNRGLNLSGSLSAGGAGSLTVQGTGGAGSGGGNRGIDFTGTLTSGGGDVTVTGVPGAGSDAEGTVVAFGSLTTAANGGTLTLVSDWMRISGGTLSTRLSDRVTLRPLTAGRLINLGTSLDTTANTLGLSDAELDRITTGTLAIGDATSGAITVSAAISPASYQVLALGQNTTFAAAGRFHADLGPTAADHERITVAGTVTLDPAAQLNLTATGGYVPQAGDTFTLLANDGSDAIGGTFSGKPEGSVLAGFAGSGSPALLTYLGGTGNDLVVTVLNAPPVAGADTLTRPATTRVVKVLKSALLANDTDVDPDPLTITAVGSALPAGATVALVGNFVVYTAPTATAGSGSFTYTLSDGPGGHTVTGTVTVTETTTPPDSPPNAARAELVGADVELGFLGVPGRTYGVQFTTDLTPPFAWQEFSPPADLVAPASGVLTYTDVAPGETSRFYRAVLQP